MFIPEFDRDYLNEKGYTFDEKVDANQKGLIIKNWTLPIGKYNTEKSDLLIILPDGYPDIKPDMWYFNPPILLIPANRLPKNTEVKINFEGKEWQRWSRHFDAKEWRSGTDGIHTYLKKVQNSLEIAS